MREAELGLTEHAFQDLPYSKADEHIHAQFYIHPKHNKAKSLEAGRPIFDDTEYVRLLTPGDKDNIIERPAHQEDKQRFPRQYAAFKAGLTDLAVSGTPLKNWPILTRGQVEELAYFKIYTVEQLAELSDSNAQQFMGIQSLRQQAKDFVAAAKDSSILGKMRSEIELRDQKIADQKTMIDAMTERLERLEKKIIGE